jgi:hypothetical protein
MRNIIESFQCISLIIQVAVFVFVLISSNEFSVQKQVIRQKP